MRAYLHQVNLCVLPIWCAMTASPFTADPTALVNVCAPPSLPPSLTPVLFPALLADLTKPLHSHPPDPVTCKPPPILSAGSSHLSRSTVGAGVVWDQCKLERMRRKNKSLQKSSFNFFIFFLKVSRYFAFEVKNHCSLLWFNIKSLVKAFVCEHSGCVSCSN